jgi:hypothetical protein
MRADKAAPPVAYEAEALMYEPTLWGPKSNRVHVHKDGGGKLWAHLPWGSTLDRRGRETFSTVIVPLTITGPKEPNTDLTLSDTYLARDNRNQLYRLRVTYPVTPEKDHP